MTLDTAGRPTPHTGAACRICVPGASRCLCAGASGSRLFLSTPPCNTKPNMKTKPLTAAAILACLLASTFLSRAQTILSGNISGTWTIAGNPYIISANATVPSGQTLTIQPGVVVWIGQGLSITVNGGIQAVGTSPAHITFQAPISSRYWNTISVNNSLTNLFNYCDFANSTNTLAFVGSSTSNQVDYCTFTNAMGTALAFNNQSSNQVSFSTFQNVSNGIAMAVNGNNCTLYAYIVNCSFTNCWGQAVSGSGNGTTAYYYGKTDIPLTEQM